MSDVARIRAHLERVETELRANSSSSLSPEQQAARAENLDRLHEYWTAGDFPINLDFPARTPYFIDAEGTACAVAHLIIDSGHRELAERLSSAANNAYLPDIHDAELDEWIASSGLTHAEHSLIQPSYGFYCTDGIQSGDESDVDCGGLYCDPCAEGAGCVRATDCESFECSDGICIASSSAGVGGAAGSGGESGSGGADGVSDATGSGGAASDGAASDGTSGEASGGTVSADGGPDTSSDATSSAGGTDTVSTTGATTGSGTDGGTSQPQATSESGDDAGCSCTTVGPRASPWQAFGLSLLLISGMLRRRPRHAPLAR
jgi:MYXO-CTERM domain-containing protein